MTTPHNFLGLLTGCFASPAAENPTVAMMEAAYKHHRLDARYINCDVPPSLLGDAVRGARAMGWVGFNLSLPHKVAVIEYLDELGESAALIGAVNCVVNRAGRLVGENTDGKGSLKSLRSVIDPAGKTIVILGAGGAARAIAVETALAGAVSITIVNVHRERGRTLVDLLQQKTRTRAELVVWDHTYGVPGTADIVINATSVGLYPAVDARLNIAFDSLQPHMVVADVIPNPPQTVLLREAAARGCRVIDGLGMLVNQGVIGIQHWIAVTADPAVMSSKLEEIFGIR